MDEAQKKTTTTTKIKKYTSVYIYVIIFSLKAKI